MAALVSGLSKQEAAATVGVRPETVSRYLRDPCVRAALRDAQGDMLGDVVRTMTAGSRDMLDVLRGVAHDADMPPSVRVRAALGWLEQAWRARELVDLDARIRELEERMANDGG